MLTKNEKLWLTERGKRPFCNYCANVRGSDDCEWDIAMGQCPIRNSHKKLLDAAEFSERVAAKLALGVDSITPCHGAWRARWKECTLRKGFWDCADCFLKAARLAVEEEMDADRK